MNVKIMKANVENLPKYYELFENSQLFDRYFKGNDRLQQTVGGHVANGNGYAAVTDGGETVGFMAMMPEGAMELPYLALLGVRDCYRGQGIGTLLLKFFIETAEAIGAPNMFIMTSLFNTNARKIYEELGFKKVAVLPNYIVTGIDEVVLMRPNSKLG